MKSKRIVSVIEIPDAIEPWRNIQIVSFPDDEEGNKYAVKVFCDLVWGADGEPDVDEGYWEDQGHVVMLVHSTKTSLPNL